jgi:hypothetical protein
MSLGFLQKVMSDAAAAARKRNRIGDQANDTNNDTHSNGNGNGANNGSGRVWLKRGELQALGRELEARERDNNKRRREQSNPLTNNNNHNDTAKNNNSANDNNGNGNNNDSDMTSSGAAAADDVVAVIQQKMTGISSFEVMRLLRQYKQPITLFGEVLYPLPCTSLHFQQHM